MAEKTLTIGSVGPLLYDDADFPAAFETDGVMRAAGVPTDPDDLARLQDLPTVSGATSTFNVVTNVQDNAGAIEVKTRQLTISNGLVSAVGVESGWTATPL